MKILVLKKIVIFILQIAILFLFLCYHYKCDGRVVILLSGSKPYHISPNSIFRNIKNLIYIVCIVNQN